MKRLSILRSLCFLAILFIVPFLSLGNKNHPNFLVSENRRVTDPPKLSLQHVLKGNFSSDLQSYFEDRIYNREGILKKMADINLNIISKPLVMDVSLSSDRTYLLDHIRPEELKETFPNMEEGISYLLRVNEYAQSKGAKMITLVFPRQSYGLAHHYPDYMFNKKEYYQKMQTEALSLIRDEDIILFDFYKDFNKNPEEFYYKTDHHPNFNAMLYAYDKIVDYLEDDNIYFKDIRDDIILKQNEKKFIGSLNRKLFNLFESDEYLTYFDLKNPIEYERYEEGVKVDNNIFYLENPYYHMYMGGDNPYTEIKTNREEYPNILVIGDSTTNALETLLWASSNNFVSIDFRHYRDESIFEVVDRFNPDIIILSMVNGFYSDIGSILK